MKLSPVEKETLGLMVDGGIRLCDYAIDQWSLGKYGISGTRGLPLDYQYQHVREWESKKTNIRDLQNKIKGK